MFLFFIMLWTFVVFWPSDFYQLLMFICFSVVFVFFAFTSSLYSSEQDEVAVVEAAVKPETNSEWNTPCFKSGL